MRQRTINTEASQRVRIALRAIADFSLCDIACPHTCIGIGASASARQMAVEGIRFVCFFYIFHALQNTLSGALRGAGAATMAAISAIGSTLVRVPLSWFLAGQPLERAQEAAVAAGQFVSKAAAQEAGVGFEHYIGIFQTWGWSMLAGLILVLPFFFGKWRDKGVTEKARLARS